MTLYNGEPSVVCTSVRLSVGLNFCANRFFSQANGRIATKLAHDGLQVSMHPGCAQGQGQGQRSRDTRTFLDSWNELLRHWRSGLLSRPRGLSSTTMPRPLLVPCIGWNDVIMAMGRGSWVTKDDSFPYLPHSFKMAAMTSFHQKA